MASSPSANSRDRVAAYRERLRQRGLRPIQIWVPDVRTPEFRFEAHRQSLALAQSAQADDDQAFIDAASDHDE
jgi:DNA-binding LacI/PurR family transcriptional regulator